MRKKAATYPEAGMRRRGVCRCERRRSRCGRSCRGHDQRDW